MESCCLGAGAILHLLFSPNTVDKQMYKYDNRTCLYRGIPSYRYIVTTLISDLLIPYSPQRALRSNNQLLLTVPRCRCKTKGGQAFSAAGPKLWNILPVNVKLC